LDKNNVNSYRFSSEIPREVKSKADLLIEDVIISKLKNTGVSILSEESGMLVGENKSDLLFIVDPIDGTVNFLRGILNCSISIALYNGNTPIFGVLASFPDEVFAWGGKMFGSYINETKITTSNINVLENGVLCTGFPSRFKFNKNTMLFQMSIMSKFCKVRMIGSASQSLLCIARGAAECYIEKEIMLWDVAAGIAIVEGAGGKVNTAPGSSDFSLSIAVDNGRFDPEITDKFI